MKQIVLIICAAALAVGAAAQKIVPYGQASGTAGTTSSQIQTTLYVSLTVDRTETIAGPYARYAQKYLGVAAPLSDKVVYGIRSASISDKSPSRSVKKDAGKTTELHMRPSGGFPKLTVDRTSNAPLSLDESARLAAQEIFSIRKNRYDLITGEAGENVFGAGLDAALKELNRLEEEYLSLFLGKQTTTARTHEFRVTPVASKQTYLVGRFSAADGLLPETDLSGQPIVVEVRALDTISTEGLPLAAKAGKDTVGYRIADDASCRIVFNNTEIYSTVIPILQFGRTIHLTAGN